jgi:phosphomannomutase
MFAASAKAEMFRCPGDAYDISRSVHLARLAAFYSKCRDCPHAPAGNGSATDSHAKCEITQLTAAQLRPGDASLFVNEGVRGRYLNELTRAKAAEIAGAMASCLWDDFICAGQVDNSTAIAFTPAAASDEHLTTEGIRILKPERPGPCVIVAHDERPSSPDIVTGVGQALRRMGCQVVDIGLATRPCWVYAVNHMQAAGGIHVTGAGCDPEMTGLDFVSQGGVPCSLRGKLDTIRERFRQGYSRPSRRPGSQRTFQASIPYEAGLWKHFHALRPLKIALACPSRAVQDVFSRVFRKLACRLIFVETPTRLRTSSDPADPDLVRVSRTIGQTRADLGVLIDDDGEQCTFLDERGRIVSNRLLGGLLREFASVDAQADSVAVYPVAWQSGWIVPAGCRVDDGVMSGDDARHQRTAHFVLDSSREYITRAMRQYQAGFGADGIGRFWFAESFAACDAILTVVHLLHALSQSDDAFSRVVENVRG